MKDNEKTTMMSFVFLAFILVKNGIGPTFSYSHGLILATVTYHRDRALHLVVCEINLRKEDFPFECSQNGGNAVVQMKDNLGQNIPYTDSGADNCTIPMLARTNVLKSLRWAYLDFPLNDYFTIPRSANYELEIHCSFNDPSRNAFINLEAILQGVCINALPGKLKK